MVTEEKNLCLVALNHIGSLKSGNNLITLVRCFNDSPEEIFKLNASDFAGITDISYSKSQSIISAFPQALKQAEKQLQLAEKNNCKIITFLDDDYPAKLLECTDFPPYLFYRGVNIFNGLKFLSVVGTRNAGRYGLQTCTKFVRDVADEVSDLCVVSGLAYGIDICAHNTALECNIPTIAVMAGGLDYIYPREHTAAAEAICQTGALISEFDFGESYLPAYFLKRNRIIAGFSDATVVIESAVRGGSLSTANFANSYNRDVFAFPGRADDVTSAGCNKLIRDNKAALISSARDFFYFVPWNEEYQKSKKGKNKEKTAPKTKNTEEKENSLEVKLVLTTEQQTLYDVIKREKNCHKDSLMLLYPTANELDSLLLSLELKNAIKQLPGNFYTIA